VSTGLSVLDRVSCRLWLVVRTPFRVETIRSEDREHACDDDLAQVLEDAVARPEHALAPRATARQTILVDDPD